MASEMECPFGADDSGLSGSVLLKEIGYDEYREHMSGSAFDFIDPMSARNHRSGMLSKNLDEPPARAFDSANGASPAPQG